MGCTGALWLGAQALLGGGRVTRPAFSTVSAGVLQEEEDVLVNVNLLDKERAEKNVELRKKKPDYLPYVEDESVDDLAQAGGQRGHRAGGVGSGWLVWEEMVALWFFRSQTAFQPVPLALQHKPRSILSKYDEELEGERPQSFRLEQGGVADGLRERELEEIRAKLRLQAQSLSTVGPRLASEYLTPEEMVSPEVSAQTCPFLSSGATGCQKALEGGSGNRVVRGPCG